MTATTHITTIDLALADALEEACGVAGVTVCANGDVIATVEQVEEAREIDWREVGEVVDAYAILRRNEV